MMDTTPYTTDEERIAKLQQLSEEMNNLLQDLKVSDQYQSALEAENRRLIQENEQLLLENRQLKERLEPDKAREETIFALLDQNSSLSYGDLGKLANCNRLTARNIKNRYLKAHGMVKNITPISTEKKDAIFALLDQNPTISGEKLAKLTGCASSYAHKTKQRWLKLHDTEEERKDA